MTQIGGSTPSYDANGNVTNDFLHSYAWDADGRPNTIDGIGITYDALGRMVEQNRSGAYTQIVYAPSGGKLALMNGSTLQKGFVPLTGGAMAVYNASGLAYYRHSDWLGSSRLASTPSRTIYSDGAYAPFGEPYAQAGASDLSFTGMNQDTVSNLYDFPAREYGIQGRWPSPDPAGIAAVSPGDPQTWNAYAYVRNNPLALTDLTGLRMTLSEHGGGGDGGPFWGYDDEEGGFDWGWSEDYGWGSGSGGGYGWGPLIAVPPDTWGLIIDNFTTDQNGNVIGSENGEKLCGVWVFCVYWNIFSGEWERTLPPPTDEQLLKAVARGTRKAGSVIPTVCGGGVFAFGGFQGEHGFVGGLAEYDSVSGGSANVLVEGEGKSGAGTGGYTSVTHPSLTNSGAVVFVPVTPATGAVAFVSKGGVGVGGYVGGEYGPAGGGVGAYANITTVNNCP